MKLKAIDTLHVSSVKAENIAPGEEFDVADDTGRQLLERKLATEVKGAKEEKSEPKPSNKMERAPINKSSFSKDEK